MLDTGFAAAVLEGIEATLGELIERVETSELQSRVDVLQSRVTALRVSIEPQAQEPEGVEELVQPVAVEDHVVNFSVAVNERWKNRNGEFREHTTWLRIVAFNGIGSACAEHLKKGDGVYVEGRLQIREYEDKDHVQRTSIEVLASKVRFLWPGEQRRDEQRPVPGQPRPHGGQCSTSPAEVDQPGADDCPLLKTDGSGSQLAAPAHRNGGTQS